MSRQRRRFYVAVPNGHADPHVISLKHKPSREVFGFSHQAVIGPFRTRQGAEFAARHGVYGSGFPVRTIERQAA